jgi:hypothetical protein
MSVEPYAGPLQVLAARTALMMVPVLAPVAVLAPVPALAPVPVPARLWASSVDRRSPTESLAECLQRAQG